MCAVKRVPRKHLHPSDAVALQDEINALRVVADCPQIIHLFDVFEEPDYTFLVLEKMEGGDLIDRIIDRRHYTEKDAKEVAIKLLQGVEFCHMRRIANRNLKPENIRLVVSFVCWCAFSPESFAKHLLLFFTFAELGRRYKRETLRFWLRKAGAISEFFANAVRVSNTISPSQANTNLGANTNPYLLSYKERKVM